MFSSMCYSGLHSIFVMVNVFTELTRNPVVNIVGTRQCIKAPGLIPAQLINTSQSFRNDRVSTVLWAVGDRPSAKHCMEPGTHHF